jgi:hypothetical protein
MGATIMGDTYFERLSQAPPIVQVNYLISGGWIAQAVGVAAELGIADLLADGPKTSDELAQATGSHSRALYRLLRTLASIGVFTESAPGRFALTPMAGLLRSDAPMSVRGRARFTTGDVQWPAWGQLRHSVKTGETAFEHVHGMNVWEHRQKHPAAAAEFNAAMTNLGRQVASAVSDAYDFSGFSTVVDVGGGHGAMMMTILRDHQALRGTVFDLPHVAQGTAQAIADAGFSDRCEVLGGDMFEGVPADGELYMLSNIIHGFDDERSIAILENCHKAMKAGGKVLMIEDVIPTGDQPSFGKLMDLNMLVSPGGQERTGDEYRALAQAAGLALTRVIPTYSSRSIVEAEPA